MEIKSKMEKLVKVGDQATDEVSASFPLSPHFQLVSVEEGKPFIRRRRSKAEQKEAESGGGAAPSQGDLFAQEGRNTQQKTPV